MIGGPNKSTTYLSQIFSANTELLAKAMSRIASGKRVQVPGDDFAGYIRASGISAEVSQYQVVKQDLQDGKAYTDFGTEVGNNILEDLSSMKSLATQYGTLADPAGVDLAEANALSAEFAALKTGIADQIADSKYNNIQIYKAANIANIKADINGTTIALTPGTVSSAAALVITNDAAIQTQIDNAETYVSTMEAFGSQLERQLKLTDTVISSKEATISVITGNDDVTDMATVTALQVRQQAVVAMMAQANVIQGYAARLYGGT